MNFAFWKNKCFKSLMSGLKDNYFLNNKCFSTLNHGKWIKLSEKIITITIKFNTKTQNNFHEHKFSKTID